MRGEYKVRGGKLVAVELGNADGVLTDVHVSGDFFLEPDSALETMNRAIEGMPASASVQAIASAIDAAVGPDVHLIGFSSEAVGIAVRRAPR